MGVRAIDHTVDPPAVLYRHLAGKDDAILDFGVERAAFLLLGDSSVAARCLHCDDTCRIEAFYQSRTLTAADVFDPLKQRGFPNELHRFPQLRPDHLPAQTFFELLHQQWADMARDALGAHRHRFPASEQVRCYEFGSIHHPHTVAALPLALEPIQRIRFIPYAHQRFHKFPRAWHAEFPS